MSCIGKLVSPTISLNIILENIGCQENNPTDMKSLGQVLKLSHDINLKQRLYWLPYITGLSRFVSLPFRHSCVVCPGQPLPSS